MIKAPYRFVPYSSQVLTPSWGSEVSHDLPFADGEDGTIVLRWKNLTPICVSEGKDRDNWCNPCSVMGPDDKPVYYLPGTSIKGMLQTVMESLCMARFDRYNDDFMGYREVGNGNRGAGYIKQMEDQHCGWLEMVDEDNYIVTEVSNEPLSVSYQELKPWKSIDDCKRLLLSQSGISNKSFDERYPIMPGKGCRLVCTGEIRGKKHQYLFGPNNGKEYSVPGKSSDGGFCFKDFCSVYKPSPYYEALLALLKKGEKVAVFYQVDREMVTSMGLTKMYRLAYKHSVSKGVSQTDYYENGDQSKKSKDLVQTIFGCIDKSYGAPLKGRVQVGHAMVAGDVSGQLVEVKGVLGSPSASFYPFYLEQTNGRSWNSYNSDSIRLSGRKRYPVHSTLTDLPEGNDNETVITKIRMIPQGQVFAMSIHVHNLRPSEIGALISAITFHNIRECHHSLGLAKPYGYGQLCLDGDLKLEGFERSIEEYLNEFEILMQSFCKKVKGQDWILCPEIKSLFNYALDNNKPEELEKLGVMSLEEYGEVKRRPAVVFDVDSNRLTFINDIIKKREDAKLIEEEKQRLEELKKYVDTQLSGDVDDSVFYEIKSRIKDEKLPHLQDEKDDLESRVTNKHEEYTARVAQEQRDEQERRIRERAERGLSILLEIRDGKYVVKDFRRGGDVINRWLRASGLERIPADQKDCLKTYLKRQYDNDNQKKFDNKWDYSNPHSYWKKVAGWTDDETAKSWAAEFKS